MPIIHPLFIDWLKPETGLAKLMLTTVAAIFFVSSSYLSIPLYPVPLSFQSLAVLLIGATLGRKLGVLAMMQVMLMGLFGLPVFADASNAYTALASPSAGYIYGFIVSVYLAGWAAEKGLDRQLWTGLLVFACAHQMIFVFGVAYISFYLEISLYQSFILGYIPFMLFDMLKFGAATVLMYYGWKVFELR